jgi:hypothetical protein
MHQPNSNNQNRDVRERTTEFEEDIFGDSITIEHCRQQQWTTQLIKFCCTKQYNGMQMHEAALLAITVYKYAHRWAYYMAPKKSWLNSAQLFPVGLCKRQQVKWPSWQTAGFVYRLTAALATVTLALLTGMQTELKNYLDICRTVNRVDIGLDWFIIILSTCQIATFSGNFIQKSYNIHSTFQWVQNCGSQRNTILYVTSICFFNHVENMRNT